MARSNSSRAAFPVDATAEACQAAVASDDTVAGNEHGVEVAADGTTDGTGRLAPSGLLLDGMRYVAVGHGRAVGNVKQGAADELLEFGAVRCQGELPWVGLQAREIATKPVFRLLKHD